MTSTLGNGTRHYSVGNLESRILAAQITVGKNIEALTVDELAAVKEFHSRRRIATRALRLPQPPS